MTRWLLFAAAECYRQSSFRPLRAVVQYWRLPGLSRAPAIIDRPLAFLVAYEEAGGLVWLLPRYSSLAAELRGRLDRYRGVAENAAWATGLYGVMSGVED